MLALIVNKFNIIDGDSPFKFLRRAYTMKFFFRKLEIFISKEKWRNISGSKMCIVKYSVCSHNQVSFIRL